MKICLTLVIALVSFALAGGGPAQAGEVWKAYNYNSSPKVPAAVGLVQIAEIVDRETKGEFKIQVHLGGSLPIDILNMTQAVGDGLVQMAGDGFYLGTVTIGGILRLPMLLSNEKEYREASRIVRPYLERAFEKRDCLVLGEYMYPLQVAWSSKKLTSLADMAGQKMRVTSPEQAEFVRRFNAVPVTIGAPDVSSALERGVVDGCFTASAGGGRTWGDLLKYNYRWGPNYFSSVFIVNKKAFQKLSPAHQSKLKEVVARVCPIIDQNMVKDEVSVTEDLRKKGMIIIEGKASDYALASKKMADFWETWSKAKGKEHQEALAKVRKAVGK